MKPSEKERDLPYKHKRYTEERLLSTYVRLRETQEVVYIVSISKQRAEFIAEGYSGDIQIKDLNLEAIPLGFGYRKNKEILLFTRSKSRQYRQGLSLRIVSVFSYTGAGFTHSLKSLSSKQEILEYLNSCALEKYPDVYPLDISLRPINRNWAVTSKGGIYFRKTKVGAQFGKEWTDSSFQKRFEKLEREKFTNDPVISSF